MAQFNDVFVKIKTNPFRPMNLAVGTVYNTVGHMAKYMVANGSADLCNSAGTLIEPPWAPKLQGIIADTVTVTIAYDMAMDVTDATGLVVNVDGTPVALDGVTPIAASGDNIVVTTASTVGVGTAVTVDYVSATGNIENSTGVIAPSYNDIVATNLTA